MRTNQWLVLSLVFLGSSAVAETSVCHRDLNGILYEGFLKGDLATPATTVAVEWIRINQAPVLGKQAILLKSQLLSCLTPTDSRIEAYPTPKPPYHPPHGPNFPNGPWF